MVRPRCRFCDSDWLPRSCLSVVECGLKRGYMADVLNAVKTLLFGESPAHSLQLPPIWTDLRLRQTNKAVVALQPGFSAPFSSSSSSSSSSHFLSRVCWCGGSCQSNPSLLLGHRFSSLSRPSLPATAALAVQSHRFLRRRLHNSCFCAVHNGFTPFYALLWLLTSTMAWAA